MAAVGCREPGKKADTGGRPNPISTYSVPRLFIPDCSGPTYQAETESEDRVRTHLEELNPRLAESSVWTARRCAHNMERLFPMAAKPGDIGECEL